MTQLPSTTQFSFDEVDYAVFDRNMYGMVLPPGLQFEEGACAWCSNTIGAHLGYHRESDSEYEAWTTAWQVVGLEPAVYVCDDCAETPR